MDTENKKSTPWRRINTRLITATVKKLFIEANTVL